MSRLRKALRPRRRWVRALFIIPFIAVLWVPFYNQLEPEWNGIPFFYWYQMLWILMGAALVLFVYLADEKSEDG